MPYTILLISLTQKHIYVGSGSGRILSFLGHCGSGSLFKKPDPDPRKKLTGSTTLFLTIFYELYFRNQKNSTSLYSSRWTIYGFIISCSCTLYCLYPASSFDIPGWSCYYCWYWWWDPVFPLQCLRHPNPILNLQLHQTPILNLQLHQTPILNLQLHQTPILNLFL